jgi:hypothetical protein
MPRVSCKRLFIAITIVLPLLVSGYAYFLAFVPYRIAASHEEAYFAKLYSTASPHASRSNTSLSNETSSGTPLQPLIHDVFQLSSFAWERELRLNLDGTAKYPMQRRWIYVGGTPQLPRSFRENFNVFSPPGKGSCVDSPSICDSFNVAFNTLAIKSYGPNSANRIRTTLAFMDCDNSPLLCDTFRINPVMLLHLETKPPCFVKKDHTFVCSKQWTYVSLPLKKMPWERRSRIGGHLVPVFPSAEEQLKILLQWEGRLEELGLEEDAYADTLVGEEGSGYTFEGVEKGDDGYEDKLRELAEFFAIIQRQTGG